MYKNNNSSNKWKLKHGKTYLCVVLQLPALCVRIHSSSLPLEGKTRKWTPLEANNTTLITQPTEMVETK